MSRDATDELWADEAPVEDDRGEALRAVLLTYQGRRVIWDLMDFCGVDQLSFAGDDHAQADFQEGRRSVGLTLYQAVLTLAPESYMLMWQEARKRRSDAMKESESG